MNLDAVMIQVRRTWGARVQPECAGPAVLEVTERPQSHLRTARWMSLRSYH